MESTDCANQNDSDKLSEEKPAPLEQAATDGLILIQGIRKYLKKALKKVSVITEVSNILNESAQEETMVAEEEKTVEPVMTSNNLPPSCPVNPVNKENTPDAGVDSAPTQERGNVTEESRKNVTMDPSGEQITTNKGPVANFLPDRGSGAIYNVGIADCGGMAIPKGARCLCICCSMGLDRSLRSTTPQNDFSKFKSCQTWRENASVKLYQVSITNFPPKTDINSIYKWLDDHGIRGYIAVDVSSTPQQCSAIVTYKCQDQQKRLLKLHKEMYGNNQISVLPHVRERNSAPLQAALPVVNSPRKKFKKLAE